ncbi:unnamed protein product [Cylindrotheca closterium]|uniref:Uncharacterized protein n=1 Tax=Cylindrotheca closterium TaxID=2856 RepID=A0AAD2G4G1_9STRA|nr:unnamed protein product [Cylindrotheca closterium]
MPKLSICICFTFLLLLTDAAIQPMLVLQHIRQQVQIRQDPIINGVVGGVLFCASDVLAQRLEHCEKKSIAKHLLATDRAFYRTVDWKRSSSAGMLGACLSCGLYPAGYGVIDKMWKGKDLISSAQKSVVEIFTVGLVANSLSMLVRGLAPTSRPGSNNYSPAQVMMHIIEELPKVTKDDFKFWFPYNMAAFTFIPTPVRPLTTMLMDSIWQTYMSLRSNNFENQTQGGIKLV